MFSKQSKSIQSRPNQHGHAASGGDAGRKFMRRDNWRKAIVGYALAVLLGGCGDKLFTERAANPLLEERLGTLDSVATTADRRLAYVRRNEIEASEPDAALKKAVTDALTARLNEPSTTTPPVGKSSENQESDNAGAGKPTIHALVNLLHAGRFGGKEGEFCAEPSPDAIESVAAAFSASGELSSASPDGSSKKTALEIGRSVATAAAAMFRRSQGVQLFRDGAFFLCQAMTNGFIDGYEYRVALQFLRQDATQLIDKEISSEGWSSAYAALAGISQPKLPDGPTPPDNPSEASDAAEAEDAGQTPEQSETETPGAS